MKLLWEMAVVLSLASVVLGQQPAKSGESTVRKEVSANQEPAGPPPDSFYKLNFAIYELDDGKRVNQRDYSMIGRTNGEKSRTRVSTRVPIFSEEKKVTYIEAGLDIRCSIKDMMPGKVQASCDFEISNFVLPEQASDARGNAPSVPVLRTTNTSTWGVLTPGKPTIISSIDDVNSKKRTQIEVTATRLD